MIRLTDKSWIAIEFKLADMWIGAFWDVRQCWYGSIAGIITEDLHVWICLIPCMPIHYIRSWKIEKEQPIRCEKCGWPIAANADDGCVPGNCSMRAS